MFICVKYKPLYKVTLDGKVIGYVEDKDRMQEKIDKFANNLEGNITSIKVEVMPVHSFFIKNFRHALLIIPLYAFFSKFHILSYPFFCCFAQVKHQAKSVMGSAYVVNRRKKF